MMVYAVFYDGAGRYTRGLDMYCAGIYETRDYAEVVAKQYGGEVIEFEVDSRANVFIGGYTE